MTEKRKLSLALILLGLGLVFTILPSHWLASNVQNAQYIRWGGVGGGFALALMVFWFTSARVDFLQLLKEARAEVLKVVWPTRQETTTYTITVIVFALLVAIYSWVLDKGVQWILYDLILRLK